MAPTIDLGVQNLQSLQKSLIHGRPGPVTVTAIDMKVPSVTIKMDDGSISSFKVEERTNLEGVKVGESPADHLHAGTGD